MSTHTVVQLTTPCSITPPHCLCIHHCLVCFYSRVSCPGVLHTTTSCHLPLAVPPNTTAADINLTPTDQTTSASADATPRCCRQSLQFKNPSSKYAFPGCKVDNRSVSFTVLGYNINSILKHLDDFLKSCIFPLNFTIDVLCICETKPTDEIQNLYDLSCVY